MESKAVNMLAIGTKLYVLFSNGAVHCSQTNAPSPIRWEQVKEPIVSRDSKKTTDKIGMICFDIMRLVNRGCMTIGRWKQNSVCIRKASMAEINTAVDKLVEQGKIIRTPFMQTFNGRPTKLSVEKV